MSHIAQLEELAATIEALEMPGNSLGPRAREKESRSIVAERPSLRHGIERAAMANLVRCLAAVKHCNDGTGGVMEAPDGNVIVKAACELLNRVQGRTPTMAVNLSADLGSGKLNAAELMAGAPNAEQVLVDMLAQVRAAREKSGGAGSSAASAAQLDAGKQG